MSDSDSENENFCYFGKPLEPYDEDSIPRKRPVSVEEQIATDAQGRRRFHGAFTGGFSAGFFNTVNTLEGWTPSEFKSSRSEKAQNNVQKPEDFMDEEDIGEFGIAPQVVKATKDYNTSRKRKKQVFSDGPIPGEPVLHNILSSGNETIGYMLLKNLGIKDKIRQQEDELSASSEGKVYGCHMPKPYEISKDIHNNNQYEIPSIYKEFFAKPKDNTFGLGYVGLDKDRFSLFPVQKSSQLVITDRNNKKMSITGQAFGVGAFEEEDDDIYMKEDMTKYDFELAGEKDKEQLVKPNRKLVFDSFTKSNKPLLNRQVYAPPQIPHSFTGKHKVRRSRFEPVQEEKPESVGAKINPTIRAKYLGEESEKQHTESKSSKQENKSEELSNNQTSSSSSSNTFDVASLYLSDRFVSSSKNEDVANILEPVEKMDVTHGTEQMREAARMKMFGPLTRETSDWVPCGLLCKRFNVPEPFVSHPEKSRTRAKNIIFEYQKHKEQELKLPEVKKEEEPRQTSEIVIEENRESVEQGNVSEVKAEPEIALVKDITEKIGVENQQDLFKAVFLSSDSESDNEDTQDKKLEEESNSRKEELKSTVLSDQLISKIKPLKEGILSSINFHKFSKPVGVEQQQQQQMSPPDQEVVVKSENFDLYGPKIPENVSLPKEKKEVIALTSESEDEWVEKDSTKKKKHKKHKKHKHKKSSHEKKKKDKNRS